jgi:hypothetical protein
MSRQPLEKKLSYRLPVTPETEDAVLLSMQEHWEGFEWVSGPVVVRWDHPDHGQVQVWAVTEEEGRGVVEHALAHMGVNEAVGTWRIASVTNPRFGRVATVRAAIVSARAGSSGAAPHIVL